MGTLVDSARMNSCGATRFCKIRKDAFRNYECCERLCRLNVLCWHTHQQEEGWAPGKVYLAKICLYPYTLIELLLAQIENAKLQRSAVSAIEATITADIEANIKVTAKADIKANIMVIIKATTEATAKAK